MGAGLVVATILAVASTACGDDTMYEDAASSSWRRAPAMPARRLEPGVAALGHQLVVVGGFDTTVSITGSRSTRCRSTAPGRKAPRSRTASMFQAVRRHWYLPTDTLYVYAR